MEVRTISAAVTFLSSEEGGRSKPAHDSPLYRPHLVIGDVHQRAAVIDEERVIREEYLGVQFAGNGRELAPEREHV